jgi:Tfp pilus assembly protein PilF
VREAGKQLEADYILEGSVQRAGQQLRINAQFIRVRDDLPLWSGKFDRELRDVLAIQYEISRGIVNGLRLKLGRPATLRDSTEAYDLYLRARALENQGAPLAEQISAFGKAITKDPSFAPACAGLATTHATRSRRLPADTTANVTKMRVAAEKAIQLDPLLAEAHDALGIAYAHDGQWEQSERSFRRAIELDPSRSMSHAHFARFLLAIFGRIDEALRQLSVAEKMTRSH